MDKLTKQEESAAIERLRALLKKSTPASDQKVDWDTVEARVFSELDEPAATGGPANAKPSWIHAFGDWFLRPVPVALSAVTAMILAAVILTTMRHPPSVIARFPLNLLYVRGIVQVAPDDRSVWRQIKAPVNGFGEVFRTGFDGQLVVRTEPGTGLAVSSNSQVKIGRSDRSCERYELDNGSISLIVKKRDGRECLEVTTANAVCEALGTVFRVEARSQDRILPLTKLVVMRGAVRIRCRARPELTAVIHDGQQVVMIGDRLDIPSPTPVPSMPEDVADSLLKENLKGLLQYTPVPDSQDVHAAPAPAIAPPAGITVLPDSGDSIPPRPGPVSPKVVTPEMVTKSRDTGADLTQPLRDRVLADEKTPEEKNPAKTWNYVDTSTAAGDLLGIPLYWESIKMRFDTVGLAAACGQALPLNAHKRYSLYLANRLAQDQGKRFLRIRQSGAIGIAILKDIVSPVLLLSQWSGSISTRGHKMSTTDTGFAQENLISNFIWERVDSVRINRPKGMQTDYTLRFYISPAGVTDFLARDAMLLSRHQIMGTSGLSLRIKTRDDTPDQNMKRLIVGAYCLVDKDMKIRDLVEKVESEMDRMKLDMSYKPPEFEEVR